MQDLIARYRKLYSGVIYDALTADTECRKPCVLDRGISRACGPSTAMVGLAFPVRGRPVSVPEGEMDLSQALMLSASNRGDVLVMDTGGDLVVAHFGDVSALLAMRAGVVGCVIDGYTRDTRRIDAMGFSVYARGATPQDAIGDWGIEATNIPVHLPGTAGTVTIDPGDVIFGDRDGVLVIPRLLCNVVLVAAEKRAREEQLMIKAIHAGKPAVDVFKEFGKW